MPAGTGQPMANLWITGKQSFLILHFPSVPQATKPQIPKVHLVMSALASKTLEEDVLTSDDARMICLNISWIGEKGIAGMEPWIEERQSPLEPDWAKIDAMQASIEMTALVMGELEVVSDRDWEMMGKATAMGARTAKKVEKAIETAEALPENVPWRQRAITKLEDLFCRIEDVAETAALAASKEFAELVEVRVQEFLNDEPGS